MTFQGVQRYATLAEAEGFGAICFALEALGLRLLGKQGVLEQYKPKIAACAANSPVLTELPERFPSRFKSFEALYRTVQTARNDAMHIGAYARHATEAAIELPLSARSAALGTMSLFVRRVNAAQSARVIETASHSSSIAADHLELSAFFDAQVQDLLLNLLARSSGTSIHHRHRPTALQVPKRPVLAR